MFFKPSDWGTDEQHVPQNFPPAICCLGVVDCIMEAKETNTTGIAALTAPKENSPPVTDRNRHNMIRLVWRAKVYVRLVLPTHRKHIIYTTRSICYETSSREWTFCTRLHLTGKSIVVEWEYAACASYLRPTVKPDGPVNKPIDNGLNVIYFPEIARIFSYPSALPWSTPGPAPLSPPRPIY